MPLKMKQVIPDVCLDDFLISQDVLNKFGITARTLEHKVKVRLISHPPYELKRRLIFEESASLMPYKKGRPKKPAMMIDYEKRERYLGLY